MVPDEVTYNRLSQCCPRMRRYSTDYNYYLTSRSGSKHHYYGDSCPAGIPYKLIDFSEIDFKSNFEFDNGVPMVWEDVI
jgi:hypothetical protein